MATRNTTAKVYSHPAADLRACEGRDAGQWTVAVFAMMFPPADLGGGPIRTLDALVREAPSSFNTIVITSDRDLNCNETLPVESNRWVRRGDARVYYASTKRLSQIMKGFRALRRERPDVLYFNGFFALTLSIIPNAWAGVFFRGSPIRLLAPRGEFSEGALANRHHKKKLFIGAFKMFRLHRGLVWHASTVHEANDIYRVWGRDADVLIRENETSLPMHADRSVVSDDGRVRAVFLSRIVPKKGLLVLLKALAQVEGRVHLEIIGNEEDHEYSKACRAEANSLPPNVTVQFSGSIPNSEIRARLRSFDVMMFPTAGENFGHVIAEALSVGCPVVSARDTPWTEILERGGGQVVDSLRPRDWRRAIDGFLELTRDERLAMRLTAAREYDAWRGEQKGPHVFELLEAHVGHRSS